jgi:hypothetical protein
MQQTFTLPEMQTALRMAGIAPASTSPLAGVVPAPEFDYRVVESLRNKGGCDGSGGLSPEWRNALATLANPNRQATIHIEGGGTARYFGGAGGVAALVPVEGGQQRVLSGLSIGAILTEIDELLGWRAAPDGPPLGVDFSIEELTTVAALADACREEQLRAVIERRPPGPNRVSRSDAERQVAMGQTKPDPHWLVSILSRFAPLGCAPTPAALDAGASALLGRGWARAADGCLELGPELATLCLGFAGVVPFLAIGAGAPWAEPAVVIFTRGLQSFWGIEFRTGVGGNRVIVSRVGARAMEEILRRHLAVLAPLAAEPPREWPVSVPVNPTARPHSPEPVSPPLPKPSNPPEAGLSASGQPRPVATGPTPPTQSPNRCRTCGKPLKPGLKFCMGCGKPVGGTVTPR